MWRHVVLPTRLWPTRLVEFFLSHFFSFFFSLVCLSWFLTTLSRVRPRWFATLAIRARCLTSVSMCLWRRNSPSSRCFRPSFCARSRCVSRCDASTPLSLCCLYCTAERPGAGAHADAAWRTSDTAQDQFGENFGRVAEQSDERSGLVCGRVDHCRGKEAGAKLAALFREEGAKFAAFPAKSMNESEKKQSGRVCWLYRCNSRRVQS